MEPFPLNVAVFFYSLFVGFNGNAFWRLIP